MIYLDKTNQAAIDYVGKFIDDNWLEQNDGTYKYQNIGYAQVKNPVKKFRGFFVDEQEEKCCYCCRDIFNDATTELEHIIPRTKSEIAQFEEYYVFSQTLLDNVVPQGNFESATTRLDKPPFPHHIAYHNIVASCNGRTFEASTNFTCCNRERKDDFVPPFNLMQDAVGYLADGTIVYLSNLTNRKYFGILNLDKDILNDIRRLWFLFSKSALTLEEVITVKPERLLEHIVSNAIANSPTIVSDIKLSETFSNPNMWKNFICYSYFFSYYSS